MRNTPIFAWKWNVGENHIMFFLYVKNYIQGSTNFQFSKSNSKEAPNPSFSGYNLREAPTPQFYGYNQKEATTPYVLQIQ